MDIDKTNNPSVSMSFLSLPRSIDFRSRLFELASSLNVLLPYFQQVFLHLPPPVKIFFHAYPLPLFSFQNNHAPPVEYSISNKRLGRYCCSNDPFFSFLFSFFLSPSFFIPPRRNEQKRKIVEISLSFWKDKYR